MSWAERPRQREQRVQYTLSRAEIRQLVKDAIAEKVGGLGEKQNMCLDPDTDWPNELSVIITTQLPPQGE